MTFSIVAMICVAGMTHADCGPEVGFNRTVAILENDLASEVACGVQSQQSLGSVKVFQNLAPGEFIKIMCLRNR